MRVFQLNKNFFQIVFIVLFGVLVFSNTMMIDTFHYDDDLTILENPAVQKLHLPVLWKSFKTRFIPGITFAWNFSINHFSAQGYHVVNVLIHLMTTLIVWAFMKDLLRIADTQHLGQEKFSDSFPFFVALIFMVHPLQTEPVNFITQRYVLLAGFFYLSTVFLYVKSKLTGVRVFHWGAVFTCVCAMFCKEISFTLPFAILLVEVFFFRPVCGTIRKNAMALAPFFLTLMIIPAALLFTSADMPGTTRIAQISVSHDKNVNVDITRAASDFTRKEYFLTELNVIRTYMRLLVWPANQNLDYDYPIAKNLKDPRLVFSVLLIGLVLYLAYRLFPSHRIASFAIVWFFLVLSIESTIIPIAHVIAEYRLYLAVFGFAYFWVFVCSQIVKDRHGFTVFMICTVGIFSLLTHHRNQVWESRISLWQDTVKKSPYKPRPNVNLGKLYTQAGQLDAAEQHFLVAIHRKPHDWHFSDTFTNLGVVYVKKGQIKKAIEMHQKAIELNPQNFLPYFNLGIAYSRLNDFDSEIQCYLKALELNPKQDSLHFSLGLAYIDKGDAEMAEMQVKALMELGKPDLAKRLEQRIHEH